MADFAGLDIRQLASLDAIVRTGSFAQAAQALGYTQGAISQQIAALERMVGAPIFDRPGGPRRARLTPVGRVLADRAADLLSRVEALSEELDRVRNGKAGVLGIGTFQSVSAEVLPTVLAQMRGLFPDLQYRIINGDTDVELVEVLESGRADVAFVATAAPHIATEHVLGDPWVVVAMPGRFPDGPVSRSVLNDEPLIGQESDAWQRQCELELYSSGVVPNFLFRTSDNTTVAAMVRAGIGSAILPLLAAMDHTAGLTVHEVDPPLQPRRILLARPTDRTVPPSADAFVQITKTVCANLSDAMANQMNEWNESGP